MGGVQMWREVERKENITIRHAVELCTPFIVLAQRSSR